MIFVGHNAPCRSYPSAFLLRQLLHFSAAQLLSKTLAEKSGILFFWNLHLGRQFNVFLKMTKPLSCQSFN